MCDRRAAVIPDALPERKQLLLERKQLSVNDDKARALISLLEPEEDDSDDDEDCANSNEALKRSLLGFPVHKVHGRKHVTVKEDKDCANNNEALKRSLLGFPVHKVHGRKHVTVKEDKVFDEAEKTK
nr:hypothetical protein Iba_chr13cCG9480 [Ipomoea batatas]